MCSDVFRARQDGDLTSPHARLTSTDASTRTLCAYLHPLAAASRTCARIGTRIRGALARAALSVEGEAEPKALLDAPLQGHVAHRRPLPLGRNARLRRVRGDGMRADRGRLRRRRSAVGGAQQREAELRAALVDELPYHLLARENREQESVISKTHEASMHHTQGGKKTQKNIGIW